MNLGILYHTCDHTPMVLEQQHLDTLRQVVDGEIRCFEQEADLIASGYDPEVLITWGQYVPSGYVAQAKNLKWIHALSAGVEGLMKLDGVDERFFVTKTANIHGIPMSEHVMTYILAFLRGLPQTIANQRKHIWSKPKSPAPTECMGKTLGVVGMGAIGKQVAQKAQMLGLRVLGCDLFPAQSPYAEKVYPLGDIVQMLEQCDFVVILVPLTPDTFHMFDKELLSHMKKEAVLINVGRGPVADEAALVEALQNGTIAGAALDALEVEPLPAESPLWDMPNVIITPHCAADSPFYFDRAFQQAADSIHLYQAGESVPYIVHR